MLFLILCASCARTEYRATPIAQFCHQCAEQRRREQSRAIQRVNYAIRRGFLSRPAEHACADCGAQATDYDHRDYTKPLEVEPVCSACNTRRGPALDSQMRAVLPVTADQDMEAA